MDEIEFIFYSIIWTWYNKLKNNFWGNEGPDYAKTSYDKAFRISTVRLVDEEDFYVKKLV